MNAAFDTLQYMETLEKSGIIKEQAHAITHATIKALNEVKEIQDLVTKKDLVQEINGLELRLTKIMFGMTWKIISGLVTFQTISLGIFGYIQHLIGA